MSSGLVSAATEGSPVEAPKITPVHLHPGWLFSYRRSLIVTDGLLVVGVVFACQALRLSANARVTLDGFASINYWIISTFLSAAWLASLGINGAWDRRVLGAGPSEYARIMQASFYLF